MYKLLVQEWKLSCWLHFGNASFQWKWMFSTTGVYFCWDDNLFISKLLKSCSMCILQSVPLWTFMQKLPMHTIIQQSTFYYLKCNYMTLNKIVFSVVKIYYILLINLSNHLNCISFRQIIIHLRWFTGCKVCRQTIQYIWWVQIQYQTITQQKEKGWFLTFWTEIVLNQ